MKARIARTNPNSSFQVELDEDSSSLVAYSEHGAQLNDSVLEGLPPVMTRNGSITIQDDPETWLRTAQYMNYTNFGVEVLD